MAISAVDNVNSGITNFFGGFSGSFFMNLLGWFFLAVALIGGGIWVYIYYRDKKMWTKEITILESINGSFQPVAKDRAKVVKLGSGGFEVLYLKNAKTWKISFGGRVGKASYYYFIGADGYWFNSILSADIKYMDKNGGLIQVVTTNPSMRTQYTSLEKQINDLHQQKATFMDKYGIWIVGGSFFAVLGILSYLLFREISPIIGSIGQLTDKAGVLIDKANVIIANLDKASPTGGIVPINLNT